MNKSELTKQVADSASMTQADAGRAVDALLDTIASEVRSSRKLAKSVKAATLLLGKL